MSSSGANVSKESAMRQWAVYACISIISETLAQLPLKLKRPDGKGGTEDATDHPLYDLVKNLPNKHMTSFSWREAQHANLMATGNCFNYIDRARYDVKAIIPISPHNVTVRMVNNKSIGQVDINDSSQLVYDIETTSGKKTFQAADILHVPGFGWDGMLGESVIRNFAKESIGNAIALDTFQASSIKNGVTPGGVLEHPDQLGDAKESFVAALEARYSGSSNARRPMILEDGMKFNKVDVSLVDKQFIEQMRMSANQICGIFKVPPHKIGIFEKNTNYNNTEQGNRAFIDGTMLQWAVRWEQAMNWKLLTRSERRTGYFFKFNFDAMLRPDSKTRSELEWREWQMGTPLNEIRKRNDMNPVENGDKAFVPVNMIPVELAGAAVQQSIDQQDAIQNEVQAEEIDSIRRYEINACDRLIKKQKDGNCNDFEGRLDEIYNIIRAKLDKSYKVLRCFNTEETTRGIIDSLTEEFDRNHKNLADLKRRNFIEADDNE